MPVPASLADLQVGGHGIHLLREFSDGSRYEFRDDCNRLTLTFELERPAREPRRPDALGEVAIFRGVPDAAVDAALGPLTIQDVADDLVLLERGEVNRSVLLVLEGAVRVYLEAGPHEFSSRMDSHLRITPGENLEVVFDTNKLHVFDRQTEQALT